MAKTFHLTIARVGERVFDGIAESVQLPGKEGVFVVLANHEPYIAELKPGEAHIKLADGTTQHVEVPNGGIAEISHNQATIIL
jgi:F0F1-type ATP synthase epsilon subunit